MNGWRLFPRAAMINNTIEKHAASSPHYHQPIVQCEGMPVGTSSGRHALSLTDRELSCYERSCRRLDSGGRRGGMAHTRRSGGQP